MTEKTKNVVVLHSEEEQELKKLAYILLEEPTTNFDMYQASNCALAVAADHNIKIDRSFTFAVGSPAYNYLFRSDWVKIDNTPKGVARRIIRLLSHNNTIPEGFIYPSKEYVL